MLTPLDFIFDENKMTVLSSMPLEPAVMYFDTTDKGTRWKILANISSDEFSVEILPGVIAGHGRLMAAKKLGLKVIPTIELIGLSEAQKKAFILADNRIALNSGWDIDLLRIELQELQDTDLAPVTGFSDEELNALLCGTTEPSEEEPEKEEPEADSFNLTLSIPIEYKEQVQDFVKSFGPEDLIQKIIDVTS